MTQPARRMTPDEACRMDPTRARLECLRDAIVVLEAATSGPGQVYGHPPEYLDALSKLRRGLAARELELRDRPFFV